MKTKRIGGIGLVAGLLLVLAGESLAFYNPQTGRWLSRDPIGENGGLNSYAFVANSSVSHYDHLGPFLTGCSRGPCADPCGDLKKSGKDFGHAAGVACCGGKKFVCVWIPGGGTATGKTGTKIIKKCLEAHERDHFDDITCPATGGPSREGWSPGKSPTTEECSAYKKERDCLKASVADCDGDPLCLNEVFARIRLVRDYMQKTLKCP